jgi:hypothetical protein
VAQQYRAVRATANAGFVLGGEGGAACVAGFFTAFKLHDTGGDDERQYREEEQEEQVRQKYRLVSVIKYRWQVVYIRHILAHAEYDEGKWKL